MDSPITWVLLMFLVLLFYGYFAFIWSEQSFASRLRKTFFRAVFSVLENAKSLDDSLEQLEINFKKLRERNPRGMKKLGTTVDLLEDMLHDYDTLGMKLFSRRCGLNLDPNIRHTTVELIRKMKLQNPFISLPAKDSKSLSDLKYALETNNQELGERVLQQLAEDMRARASNEVVQERKYSISIMVATIGAILTLFFGIISFTDLL